MSIIPQGYDKCGRTIAFFFWAKIPEISEFSPAAVHSSRTPPIRRGRRATLFCGERTRRGRPGPRSWRRGRRGWLASTASADESGAGHKPVDVFGAREDAVVSAEGGCQTHRERARDPWQAIARAARGDLGAEPLFLTGVEQRHVADVLQVCFDERVPRAKTCGPSALRP